MSYYNSVEIDRNELRNLRNRAKEATNLRNRLERERERRASDINRMRNKILNTRNEFNNKVSKLNRLNENLSKELRDVNSEFLKTKTELKRTKKEFSSKISELNENFSKEIEKVNSEILKTRVDINTIKREVSKNRERINKIISDINREKQEKKELASYWMKNLDGQIEMIKSLEHEKFKPGELNRLITQIELAKKNYENGVYESAISSLQERYLDAVELFEEVFILQREFEELKEQALKRIADIKVLIEAQRVVDYELEGETIKIETDYWSEGRLSKIEEEVQKLEKEVNDKNTTTERMIEILEYEDKLIEELTQIAEVAKHNAFLYQGRVDTANDIIDILEDLDFEIIEDALVGDDKRKPLFLKLENESEEEIIVVASKKKDKNVLNIMFDIESTNPKFKDRRLEKIIKELNNKGIKLENFSCTDSETPRNLVNEFKDFEKIKEGKVEDKLEILK
jgi:exonuclease SbcC